MIHPGKVLALKVSPKAVYLNSSKPARAGPEAIPKALALTNAADACSRDFEGTQSLMYRLLTALAEPSLATHHPTPLPTQPQLRQDEKRKIHFILFFGRR